MNESQLLSKNLACLLNSRTNGCGSCQSGLCYGDGATGATGAPGTASMTGSTGPLGHTGAIGATGYTGPAGSATMTGATGPTGFGVPSGGAAGTVLTKNSATNYDVSWTSRSLVATINIYDTGTDYDCTNAGTTFTIPAIIGAASNITVSSFNILLNATFYNASKFPLYSVGCFYLTTGGFWRYTSVRVGNTSGSILSSVNSAVTTISFTGINRANLVSPATATGLNLKIFLTFAN